MSKTILIMVFAIAALIFLAIPIIPKKPFQELGSDVLVMQRTLAASSDFDFYEVIYRNGTSETYAGNHRSTDRFFFPNSKLQKIKELIASKDYKESRFSVASFILGSINGNKNGVSSGDTLTLINSNGKTIAITANSKIDDIIHYPVPDPFD